MVILTNGSDGATLGAPCTRRLLELWFDGKPKAEKRFDLSIRGRRASLQSETRKIERSPDKAWSDALLGSYRDPRLGKIQIQRSGADLILDTGEWSSALGRKETNDGGIDVVLLDPAASGMELVLENDRGVPSLELLGQQEHYVFKRVKE